MANDITGGSLINKVTPGNAGTAVVTIEISGTSYLEQVLVRVSEVWERLLKTTDRRKTWRIEFSKEVKDDKLTEKAVLYDGNNSIIPADVSLAPDNPKILTVTPQADTPPGRYYIQIDGRIESITGETLTSDLRAWFEVE